MDQPPEDPDLNESKKKDEKNAKKRLQRLGEPNRGSNLRQQSNLSFFKPKASPRSKTHKPNSSSCGQMASNHLLASSSQQRNEQDDFPPADVEAAGHPAAAPLEGLDSFQNVTNPTETTVDVDEMRSKIMENVMIDIQKAADIQNDAFTKAVEKERALTKERLKGKEWQSRNEALHGAWTTEIRTIFVNAKLKRRSQFHSVCTVCKKSGRILVCCYDCKQHLCWECDYAFHFFNPLHARVYKTSKNYSTEQLLPTEFLNEFGQKIEKDVPVTCFPPSRCWSCNELDTCVLNTGTNDVTVITVKGRFDLKSASFSCTSCGECREALDEEYVYSEWIPGKPGKDKEEPANLFFDEHLLDTWYEIQNNTPGTSQEMFLRSLSQMSTQNGRSSYINPILFSKAYDENNLMRYRIQNEVLLYKPGICWACGEHPIALHVDGNFKCYRCITAKGFETDPLFQDIMIASDKDVKEFLDLINNVIPPQSKNKENCGAAVYQAAKTTSSSMKGLDETGLLIMSCRHGWVWRALNLFMGETYRHVLYLHEYAKDKNVRFFCYDVVCQYWIFLLKVTQTEELRERFEGLITLTIDFLSRWHGKTHAWFCQLLHLGSYKKGAGATSGESQEQNNAHTSRFVTTTKHMSASRRIDTFSASFIKENWSKIPRMVKGILKTYHTARVRVKWYRKQTSKLMDARLEKVNLLCEKGASLIEEQKVTLVDYKQKLEHFRVEGNKTKVAKMEKLITLAKKKIKRYSADVNRLKQEKLYKNHEQDLRCIYVKLVRFAERCKSNNSVTVNTPFQEAINNLEGLFLEIQVLKRKVSKDAERSKQRKRLQKRIRTVKDKARKLMSKIKEQYKLDISEEQFDSGKIRKIHPLKIPYHEDQQLCEAWMLTCRYEEEVIISPNELKQFFATLNQLCLDLQDKLKNQTGRIIEITSKIEEGCAASSLLDEKEILSGSNFLIQSEIYNLSCIASTGLDLLRNDLLKAKEGMDDEELLEHLILSEDFSGTIPNADEDLDEEDADEDEDDDYDYEDFETDESGSEDVGINPKSNVPDNEDHRAEELFWGNLDDEDCGI